MHLVHNLIFSPKMEVTPSACLTQGLKFILKMEWGEYSDIYVKFSFWSFF